MRRIICLLTGLLALVLLLWLGVAHAIVMPSYLAAWLALASFPLGALALLMGIEASGKAELPIAACLRPILLLMPVVAVLALPILLRPSALFPWLHDRAQGFAGAWFAHGPFLIRQILLLAVWCALAWLYWRAPPASRAAGRRSGSALALLLHVALVTVAADDWVMSLQPGFLPSGFGLLLLSAQCGSALSLALLLPTRLARESPAQGSGLKRGGPTLLLMLLGVWAFLHFTQFLIVWSANLPHEAVWYLSRGSGLGEAAEWLLPIMLLLALVVLSWRPSGLLVPMAALVLAMHLVEMLWLVTPSFRGHFLLNLPDLLALLGMAGLALALIPMSRERHRGAA